MCRLAGYGAQRSSALPRWYKSNNQLLRGGLDPSRFNSRWGVLPTADVSPQVANQHNANGMQPITAPQTSIQSRPCNIVASIRIGRVVALTAIMSAFVFSAQALILSAYGS